MARALNTETYRLVVYGDPDGAPTKLAVEYRVENGDMCEDPKHTKYSGTDMSQSVNTLWAATKTQVDTDESL